MNRILVIIHILFLLISCSTSNYPVDTKVFRYNSENDITSLDPAFATNQDNVWAVTHLFNGLLQLDSNLQPIPCIAKSWELNENGKIYTFHLRSDVHFHRNKCFSNKSGRRVVASDFVYTFQRIMDSKTASPGAWIFNDKLGADGFVALNDSTLQITLHKPFAPFTGILSMPYCMVLPKEAIDFYGKEFSQHPVGTGPFQFATWEQDVALVLTRNSNYFENPETLGNIGSVHISFVHNRQMALLLFLEGKLDMYSGISGAVKDFILDKEGLLQAKLRKDIILQKMPFLNTEYLAMYIDPNDGVYPWNNTDFRKAVSLSVDRETMLKHLRNGVGHPADGGFTPTGLQGHLSGLSNFDKDLAVKHLQASGYLNNPVPVSLNTISDYSDLCIYVQKQLTEMGVNCQINVIPAAHLKEAKRQGKLMFFRASWIMDYPDAENYLSCFYSKNFSPNGPNYTHFSNSVFDLLYEASLIETDDDKRYALYQQMEHIIHDVCPIIVLFYDESVRLTRNWVKGLNNNALNIPILKSVNMLN